MREGQTLPPSASSSELADTKGKSAEASSSTSWPVLPDQDAQPKTLADFHKMRARSQSGTFGFGGIKHSERSGESSGRKASSGSRSTPTSPQRSLKTQSNTSRPDTVGSVSSAEIKIEPSSPDHSRVASPVSPVSEPSEPFQFPRNMPIARSLNRNAPLGALTVDQVARISRVLDDMEMDFTGKISQFDTTIHSQSTGSNNTGSYRAESTKALTPLKGKSAIDMEEDTEAIDPIMHITRKGSKKSNWQARLSTVESLATASDGTDRRISDQAGLPLDTANRPLTPQTPGDDNQLLQASPIHSGRYSPSPSLLAPVEIVSTQSTPHVSPNSMFRNMFPSPSSVNNQPWAGPLRKKSSEDMLKYWANEHTDDEQDDASLQEEIALPASHSPSHAHKYSEASQLSSVLTLVENDALFSPLYNLSTTSLASDSSSYRAERNRDCLSDDSGEYPSFSSTESARRKHPFEFDDLLEDRPKTDPAEKELLSQQVLGGLQIEDLAFIQAELVRTAAHRHQLQMKRADLKPPPSPDSGLSITAASSANSGLSRAPLSINNESSLAYLFDSTQNTPALSSAQHSPASEDHGSLPPTPATARLGPGKQAWTPTVETAFGLHSNETSFDSDQGESTSSNIAKKPLRPTSPPPVAFATPRGTLRPRPPQATQSILLRDVAVQAEHATLALKGDPSTPRALNRRKSSKSLKISAPHLLSSSVNLATLQERSVAAASPVPSPASQSGPRLEAKPAQYISRGQGLQAADIRELDQSLQARTSYETGTQVDSPVLGQYDGNNWSQQASPAHFRSDSRQDSEAPSHGLSKLLTRLRRKRDPHEDVVDLRHVEPFALPAVHEPPLRANQGPPEQDVRNHTVALELPRAELYQDPVSPLISEPSPTSPTLRSSAGSRAPVTYEVGSWRKRKLSSAGSDANASLRSPGLQKTSIAPSVNSGNLAGIRESWVPLPPEQSMASWRSSLAVDESPASTDETLRKLREAASALGLDQAKVDDLVSAIPSNRTSEAPSFNRSVVRRTIIFSTAPGPEVIPEETSGRSSPQEESANQIVSPLRSVHDRTPTPPPVHRRHSRTVSDEYIMQHPIPSSPRSPVHAAQSSQGFAANTLAGKASFLDFGSIGVDEGQVVLARGSFDETDQHTIQVADHLPQPSLNPKDRLEIDEMSDGSLVWQVIRDLRHTSQISDLDFQSHSRQSSVESTVPLRLNTSPLKINKRDEPSMKLVFSKTHQRLRSNESVGKLNYINSRSRLVAPIDEDLDEKSMHSEQSLEVYQADDAVVSNLISDLTSKTDNGSFNLAKRQSSFYTKANKSSARSGATTSSKSSIIMRTT